MKPPRSLRHPPPKSNAERQREFRKRNPGYFNKYKVRPRKRVPQPVTVEATQPATMLALPEPVVSLLPDLLAAAMKREATVAQREAVVTKRETELVQSTNIANELPIVF